MGWDFYTYISLTLMKKSDIGQGYPCEFLSPFLIQEEAIHEQGRVSTEPGVIHIVMESQKIYLKWLLSYVLVKHPLSLDKT